MSSIIEGFELALPDADASGAPLVPGSHAARELEKAVSFAGASLASAGLSGFDVAAAMLGLRDVLVAYVDEPEASRVRAVFEWLTIIALDSHGSATAMSATERMREQLERGTPVVAVVPEVPAVFLVGAPDSAGLDSIFARLMLLVVRVGATSVIIDTTGLDDAAEPALVEAVGRFLGHRKVAGAVEALAVGLDDEQIAVWRHRAGPRGAADRAQRLVAPLTAGPRARTL
jgi:hypothetical protein